MFKVEGKEEGRSSHSLANGRQMSFREREREFEKRERLLTLDPHGRRKERNIREPREKGTEVEGQLRSKKRKRHTNQD